MLVAHLTNPGTYDLLLKGTVWQSVLDWLRQMPVSIAEGVYELRCRDVYVTVQSYATTPRAQCRFESHRDYVDLQYCITGGEIIEWTPTAELTAQTTFDSDKDIQFYQLPTEGFAIRMVPGRFAVFAPEDGHSPKISDGVHPQVKKLVVKVRRNLL